MGELLWRRVIGPIRLNRRILPIPRRRRIATPTGVLVGFSSYSGAILGDLGRMKDGEVQVTDDPYVETKETLGGILLLEARDLNHASAHLSKHLAARMTTFEIRPANEAMNRLVAERSAAVAKAA
jgi:hypothetical protein